MIIELMEQQSAEWYLERIGKVTASRVADVIAERKKGNGELECRRAYRSQIIAELLSGNLSSHYVSPQMQWGVDNEELARAAYEMECDALVELVGLAVHPTCNRFAASPDGLVGTDGLVEIKCPDTSTHIDYLVAGVVPDEYQPQMLAQMACTERQWCDFVSFDPRLPKRHQLFVRRFPRDDARIAEMEKKVLQFLAEVDKVIAQLDRTKAVDLVPVTLLAQLNESVATVLKV